MNRSSSPIAVAVALSLALPCLLQPQDLRAEEAVAPAAKKPPRAKPSLPKKAAATPVVAEPAAEVPAAVPEAPPQAPKPWEEGVAPVVQAEARALFREGTARLNEASFAPATASFEKALALWGHPAIHFNMAMAQVQLDRPLDARKHLIAAMAFGPEPLGDEKFESARTYQKLVEKQLAHALIRTGLDGVQVALDGEPLFTSPDTFEDFLPAGTHAIVAKKEGYLTSELSETFAPGAARELDIRLFTAEELTEYRRRWPVWMPWTVFGAGVALAAVGGALHGVGIARVHDFDERADDNGLDGIETTSGNRAQRREGINLQRGAIGLYAAGGAALAAGITLIVLNRPKPYLFGKPVDASAPDGGVASPSALNLVPLIGADGAGMAASLRF